MLDRYDKGVCARAHAHTCVRACVWNINRGLVLYYFTSMRLISLVLHFACYGQTYVNTYVTYCVFRLCTIIPIKFLRH